MLLQFCDSSLIWNRRKGQEYPNSPQLIIQHTIPHLVETHLNQHKRIPTQNLKLWLTGTFIRICFLVSLESIETMGPFLALNHPNLLRHLHGHFDGPWSSKRLVKCLVNLGQCLGLLAWPPKCLSLLQGPLQGPWSTPLVVKVVVNSYAVAAKLGQPLPLA